MNKLYYSPAEAAQVLGIGITTFRNVVMNKPGFPVIRLSPRRLIIPADKLQQWIEKQI